LYVKSLLLVGAGIVALSFATTAAAEDVEALIKANGCPKCHTLTTKKKGPAFQTTAAKWKKDKTTAEKGVASIKENHEDLTAKDGDLKTIATWILTL
jgi:cytochrome c551/c552